MPQLNGRITPMEDAFAVSRDAGNPPVRFDVAGAGDGVMEPLNGHEAGNGGHSQGASCTPPRRSPTRLATTSPTKSTTNPGISGIRASTGWAMCKCGCSRLGRAASGRVWRAVVLALLVLAMTVASSTADSEPKVRVVIELFQVALVDSTSVRYLRREALLDRRGPDTAVAGLLRGKGGAPALLCRRASGGSLHQLALRGQRSRSVDLPGLRRGAESNGRRTARRANHPDERVTWDRHDRSGQASTAVAGP